MIRELADGKFCATWLVGTVMVNGHTLIARSETLEALTGLKPSKVTEVQFVGSREECERQL